MKWEDLNIKERVIVSIKSIERRKKFNFPDGIPMDLRETDINRYHLLQSYEIQLALLESLLKGGK